MSPSQTLREKGSFTKQPVSLSEEKLIQLPIFILLNMIFILLNMTKYISHMD